MKTSTTKTSRIKNKLDTSKIEVVEWEDAQAEAGWYGDDLEPELAKVITVGFLISETKRAVCIASTISPPDSNAHMHIPKAWIKNRRKISIVNTTETGDKNENKEGHTTTLN
tara:strand:- start:143 stop:478 length:336 start_codon:yes stop_codon:yes gene_type:complete